jgi:hypothetical protein
MLSIIATLVFTFTNGQLARKKGKSPVAWGFLTVLAYFIALFLCSIFYLLMVYKGPQTPEAIQATLSQNPLTQLLLELLGIGGPLLVRYILERSDEGNAP